MAEVKITAENFDAEVTQAEGTVLLDFWAPWCGPCRMLAPVLAELAEEQEGKIKVGKVNVDEEGALAERFGIMSIPTLILMRGGEPIAQRVGYCTKEQLENFIQ